MVKFTLVKRRPRSRGHRAIYYCRIRTDDGRSVSWRSTGEREKPKALQWAMSRLKTGGFVSENITFAKFAEGWWQPECEWVRRQEARGREYSPRYLESNRTALAQHILPAFGAVKLGKITPAAVEDFVFRLRDKEGLSPSTANKSLVCLRLMLAEAERKGMVERNPAFRVKQLVARPKQRGILSAEETHILFAENTIESVWRGNVVAYAINLLALNTGMRLGECEALQVQHTHLDGDTPYVAVVYGYSRKYGLTKPKFNESRLIPVPPRVVRYLRLLIDRSPYRDNPETFVFHNTKAGGLTPLDNNTIIKFLHSALDSIGVDWKARNVCFHSWRHEFNSFARFRLPDFVVRALTGHRSEQMTDHYTHITLADLGGVKTVQEALLE